MAILTFAAAAFIVVSGLPAQAQSVNFDFSLFPPAPAPTYYGSNCSSFMYDGFTYTSCNAPTYVYNPAPAYVYYPYPPDYYSQPSYVYYVGP